MTLSNLLKAAPPRALGLIAVLAIASCGKPETPSVLPPSVVATTIGGEATTGRAVLSGKPGGAITAPQSAIQFTGDQASVTLVSADYTAERRRVNLGDRIGDRWVVTSGLNPGDRVIVEGWQRLRPGQQVDVQEPRAIP